MNIKKRILAISISLVLLLGLVLTITACDDWHYDLESDKFWGFKEGTEADLRDPTKEFITLRVGDRFGIKRDVLMRKDVFIDNPFFSMFTDEGYNISSIISGTNKLSYITKALEGKLEVQYLLIGGICYFYDFDDAEDLWEAALTSVTRPAPLQSNTITDELKQNLMPTTNPTNMGLLTRRYFEIEQQVRVNWRKETATFSAKMYGTEERVEVLVRTDSTFYRNLMASLNGTADTTGENFTRIRGGVNYKNKWYLVHQV